MLIAIDIDEVLADFSAGLVKYFYKKHKIKLRNYHRGNTEWWQAWGSTKEGAIGRVYDYVHSREIMDIEPIKGSRSGVKALKKQGHELIVVTGRPVAVLSKTKKWVEKYYPGAFFNVYSTDFHIVNKGRENKGNICRRKGVDLLIDDYYDYCLEAIKCGIDTLLFTTRWNRGLELPAGMKRVDDWGEVLRCVGDR